MKTPEFDQTTEYTRSAETVRYRESAVQEEFFRCRDKRVDELAGAPDTPSVRRRRQSGQKGILGMALAAVATAAVVTVAVVSNLVGVTLRTKTAGYDYVNYEITVKNRNDRALYGRLSNGGEMIGAAELSDDDATVGFENLMLNMTYLFEVVDDQGKVHFSDTIQTRSPLRFYRRDDIPDTLFYAVDREAFKGSGVYYPLLRDSSGQVYELPVQTDWEREAAIHLENFAPGEYELVIVDAGEGTPVEIYAESVFVDGLLPASP